MKNFEEFLDWYLQRIIKQFNSGVLARGEIVNSITPYILHPRFRSRIKTLPNTLIEILKELAHDAPAHPEDVWAVLACVVVGPEFNMGAWVHQKCMTDFWRGKLLREYFFPDKPLPDFEEVKCIGIVESAIDLESCVVIVADLDWGIIREHPTHITTPQGQKIDTRIFWRHELFSENDRKQLDDLLLYQINSAFGLDEHVRFAREIPPESKVWVDRTGSDIPPLREAEQWAIKWLEIFWDDHKKLNKSLAAKNRA